MNRERPSSGFYILSLSVHGLVRGTDIELGRDADTGGQVKYVVEQARALARHPAVRTVELVTRQVIDQKIDASYAEPRESLGEGVFITRVPFGPRRYLHKENLWPHLHGLVDQILHRIRKQRVGPDIIHGHYADAGYVGAQLAKLLGVPFVFTGHSLGRVKQTRLLEKGSDPDGIEKRFHFLDRIEAEEMALEEAALVITSTTQEVNEQYEIYDHYQPDRMEVIPPGVDLDRFFPPDGPSENAGTEPGEEPAMARTLARFLRDPTRPMILALARPDEKKNFTTMIRAFAEDPRLRETANLVLVAGNRDDINQMDSGARKVLNQILALVDRYDLYGSVAYPKHHRAEDVPELFRLAARSRGVFLNAAITEPFGLTLIEAAASGLPIVATHDGGPTDIVKSCQNGHLVDPLDPGAIAVALHEVLDHEEAWTRFSRNGIQGAHEHYAWKSHVAHYMNEVKRILRGIRPGYDHLRVPRTRLTGIDRLLVTDVDNTLTGDDEALHALFERLEATEEKVGFAVATGRGLESTLTVLEEMEAPTPDIVIAGVGTEIYYGKSLAPDSSWQRHIDWYWRPDHVHRVMDELPGLALQPAEAQRRYKISYLADTRKAPTPGEIHRYLRQRDVRVNLVVSFGAYIDVIPIRASAGMALRFLGFKWNLPPERMLVAGDSGNDEDMLSGNTLGVVVGNYSPELEPLRGQPRIYFAEGQHGWGILEGIDHYQFLEPAPVIEEVYP